MNVLLTNIGNRNIIFDGKTYNELDISKKNEINYLSFRDWTSKIDECFEDYETKLDINIINPIIDDKDNFDLIILYYSDQQKFDTRIDQDTIYEATIIKKILIKKYKYKEEKISNVPVKCKVIDNGELLNFYRMEIIRLKKKYQNLNLTICDAGGTAQQKMALKVIAEFLMNPEKYKVLYVENNALITDVNVNEYRNVINTEQAVSLIYRGEYIAASELLGISEIIDLQKAQKYDWKGKLLSHVNFRFHQNRKDAQAIIQGMQISNELIKNYKDSKAFAENSEMEDVFGIDWIDITEKLYKAIYYYNLKNYSLSILTFSQFYEYFLEKLIPQLLPGNEYGTPKSQNLDQFQNFQRLFTTYYQDYLKLKPDFRPKMDSVNSGIMVVKVLGNHSSQIFAKLISPYIDFTDDCKYGHVLLNVTRNQIAHQGKFISESDINKSLKYYPNLLTKSAEIFKLSRKDLFQDLGVILENSFRQ